MGLGKTLSKSFGKVLKRRKDATGHEVFVAAPRLRSVSDNGRYIAAVVAAVTDPEAFRNFKRNRDYQEVLEHATHAHGAGCLAEIERMAPDLLSKIDVFKTNDELGGATTFDYPGIGRISPSTLRYVKIAAEIRGIFGMRPFARIAEVGCGYGGQLLILDKLFEIRECHLFDLMPVLDLTSRYLESHLLDCSYAPWTINRHPGGLDYDLAISNYAFSELPSRLQRKYVEKVFSRARAGYLIMNSGRPGCAFTGDHLSLAELRELLPPCEVLDERPFTHPGNYLIVWGRP